MAMNTPQVTKAELPQVLTVLLVRLKMNKLKWASLVCCLQCLFCRSAWTFWVPINPAHIPGLTQSTVLPTVITGDILVSSYVQCCFVFENRWHIWIRHSCLFTQTSWHGRSHSAAQKEKGLILSSVLLQVPLNCQHAAEELQVVLCPLRYKASYSNWESLGISAASATMPWKKANIQNPSAAQTGSDSPAPVCEISQWFSDYEKNFYTLWNQNAAAQTEKFFAWTHCEFLHSRSMHCTSQDMWWFATGKESSQWSR